MSINGAQSVRLEKVTNEFKNYYKQIPVPFKIYADFVCNVKSVESYEDSYSKKYQGHVPCSFAYKFICVYDEFTKPIVVFWAYYLQLFSYFCKKKLNHRFSAVSYICWYHEYHEYHWYHDFFVNN